MKKRSLLLEELLLWLRGRFTLTDEEKVWVLLILFICWAGLLARHLYNLNDTAPPPPAREETPPAP